MEDNHPLPHPKRLKTLASTVAYPGGNTLLHQFVLDNSDPNPSKSESDINAVLLSLGDINVNERNGEGHTALHLAVLKNNLLMVKKLLSCLPDVDVEDGCWRHPYNTPLHTAAELGYVAIVQELLDKGADVNASNEDCCTPLFLAGRSGHLDVVKLLVHRGADLSRKVFRSPNCLHYAAESGNVEIVKLLIKHGADLHVVPRFIKVSVLHIAARSGDLATVQFLVSQGADMNARDGERRAPLAYAAMSGDLATVEFLASNGPGLKGKNGEHLLCAAASHGHLEVVKYFLDRIPNVDINRVLFHAALSSRVETLQYLVDNGGGDVNAKGRDKMTPLHWAAHSAAAQFLVSKGAKINVKDKKGKTPLHAAAYGGHAEVAAFLIGQGADLHARDRKGKTPLHDAARRNKLECAKLLIDRGADPNARCKEGSTPLHDAKNSFYENSKCIRLLIKKGANRNAKNKKGVIACDPESDESES